MGRKAFENPLLGHARMRAIYRALIETRLLAPHLGEAALPTGLEACWVGTAIDLRPGDLASDHRGGALIEHIRAAGLRQGSGALPSRDLRRTLDFPTEAFAGSAADRLLCAVGAAMATRAAAQAAAVMAFLERDELSGKEWKHLLRIAAQGNLPLILVAVPGPRKARRNLTELAREASAGRIPVIPVDASDAVALYRVAQESLVRARAEGGTMIVDCIRGQADPIDLMGAQLVKKRICTTRWLDRVLETATKTIRSARSVPTPDATRKRSRSSKQSRVEYTS
jgi:TPP-dependent pyruvate/acetoin dehydrogenase alpha subunit